MKLLIAADMEGISGVVHWDHVSAGHAEYLRFRRLMTADVNAAVRGAFDAGAAEVMVADGHGSFRSVLVEDLDPRARLYSGGPRPLAMVQGADEEVDGAMFVGYHARVGTQNAILDHTWSGSVAGFWFNGQPMGEIGMNAAVCGHYGVPVIMISGDQTACAEAEELLGSLEKAIVKRAVGRMAAECLSPEAAQQRIYEAARRAVRRLESGQMPPPLILEPPITATIELTTSEMADGAAIAPGVRRLAGKRIEVMVQDVPTAYRAVRAALSLTRS